MGENADPIAKKSSWKPILITLVAGIILSVGSCYGFLQTLTNDFGLWFTVFAVVFVVSAAAAVRSVGILLGRGAMRIYEGQSEGWRGTLFVVLFFLGVVAAVVLIVYAVFFLRS